MESVGNKHFAHAGVCYFCCAIIPDTEFLCEECKGTPKGVVMDDELEKINPKKIQHLIECLSASLASSRVSHAPVLAYMLIKSVKVLLSLAKTMLNY